MLTYVRRSAATATIASRMAAFVLQSSPASSTTAASSSSRVSTSVTLVDYYRERFAAGVCTGDDNHPPSRHNHNYVIWREHRDAPLTNTTTPSVAVVAPPRKKVPKYRQPDFQPLSVYHPAFGQLQAPHVGHHRRRGDPLSTVHPAFGAKPEPLAQHLFRGPIGISGFFLAVDPNLAIGPLRAQNRMNPNAQLTIRDQSGNLSRVRYRCQLEAVGGLRVEAIVRFQVGWISPRVTFSEVPNVIHLGRGFDVSVPFLFHFTMVSILDERGCATGSSLYFSGTPMLGLSIGYSSIRGGKLVIDPGRALDPTHETAHHFIGHVHYRQLGFVVFKVMMWVLITLACIPPVRRWVATVLPNPLYWYSEENATPKQCINC
ncbi:Hypothetical protein, putative [Bodo saltans]|uniref:Uncharacterized protein n=1 Tax=Bodo saltans TaxID=75058 RepID=A0A0S4JRN1_BODSA|nr:Hypothetical protein, putative [Bodo saltans]|eukprot:CUG94168.1 Hypothetical protein, putative [Bodo saltans]